MVYGSGEFVRLHSGGSGSVNGKEFIVHQKIIPCILGFSPVNDRLCKIRIKAKLINLTIFYVYASTEEADNEKKKRDFYTRLEE